MKETMVKHFFAPIWKCDEIEAELSHLEKEGWRLDKISGFRKFEFTKATPKDKAYFFTFYTKDRNMFDYECFLKREYKANEIKGRFIDSLVSALYRMPQNVDLIHCTLARNFFLRYVVLQYVWMGLCFLACSVPLIILSILSILSANIAELIFSALIAFIGASLFFPNFYGWIYLRRKYRRFGESEQEGCGANDEKRE